MKNFIDAYIAFGEHYWWAFLIIWLLLIIVAHIPNFVDFHYIDLILPGLVFAIWCILEILRCLCLV
ncbi:hypothetical protein [Bacteroides heparinolyticus]|uniref:hypothetical protein n=1 Tax=Prevotella heparinolytica TaxID=28113 RepID=UPI0023F13891|nr:hypothetical protein [Bacteroides heparinolyticus]